jgi:hypothetical protein
MNIEAKCGLETLKQNVGWKHARLIQFLFSELLSFSFRPVFACSIAEKSLILDQISTPMYE